MNDYPPEDPMYEPPHEENKKEKKGRVQSNYTASYPNLCEVVEVEDETAFLEMNGELKNEVTIKGKTYYPPQKEKIAFELPTYEDIKQAQTGVSEVSTGVSQNDLASIQSLTGVSEGLQEGGRYVDLFNDLEEFHKESAELPDERMYTLIAAWDIHTHLIDRFEYSPIIFFAGLPEKGKSRMAKSMIAVARRGLIKASVSDAQIIREASDQEATLFFDMTDFWTSITKSGSEDVVLSRFERGLKVARVLNPDKGKFNDITYFGVFGPTIIASNEVIEQVLGSRTVTIIMKQAKRKFERGIDYEKAKQLRARIIVSKMSIRDTKLPEVDKIVGGRFGDIVQPLHQIIKFFAPHKEEIFKQLILDIEKKKFVAKSQTIEGDIVRAIISLGEYVQRAALSVKEITNKVNEELSDRDRLTYQKVGRKLDIMGYEKMRTANGSSAIRWSEDLNQKLAFEHDVTITGVSNASLGIQESTETPETPEHQNTTTISNNINNNIDNKINKNIVNQAFDIFNS